MLFFYSFSIDTLCLNQLHVIDQFHFLIKSQYCNTSKNVTKSLWGVHLKLQ